MVDDVNDNPNTEAERIKNNIAPDNNHVSPELQIDQPVSESIYANRVKNMLKGKVDLNAAIAESQTNADALEHTLERLREKKAGPDSSEAFLRQKLVELQASKDAIAAKITEATDYVKSEEARIPVVLDALKTQRLSSAHRGDIPFHVQYEMDQFEKGAKGRISEKQAVVGEQKRELRKANREINSITGELESVSGEAAKLNSNIVSAEKKFTLATLNLSALTSEEFQMEYLRQNKEIEGNLLDRKEAALGETQQLKEKLNKYNAKHMKPLSTTRTEEEEIKWESTTLRINLKNLKSAKTTADIKKEMMRQLQDDIAWSSNETIRREKEALIDKIIRARNLSKMKGEMIKGLKGKLEYMDLRLKEIEGGRKEFETKMAKKDRQIATIDSKIKATLQQAESMQSSTGQITIQQAEAELSNREKDIARKSQLETEIKAKRQQLMEMERLKNRLDKVTTPAAKTRRKKELLSFLKSQIYAAWEMNSRAVTPAFSRKEYLHVHDVISGELSEMERELAKINKRVESGPSTSRLKERAEVLVADNEQKDQSAKKLDSPVDGKVPFVIPGIPDRETDNNKSESNVLDKNNTKKRLEDLDEFLLGKDNGLDETKDKSADGEEQEFIISPSDVLTSEPGLDMEDEFSDISKSKPGKEGKRRNIFKYIFLATLGATVLGGIIYMLFRLYSPAPDKDYSNETQKSELSKIEVQTNQENEEDKVIQKEQLDTTIKNADQKAEKEKAQKEAEKEKVKKEEKEKVQKQEENNQSETQNGTYAVPNGGGIWHISKKILEGNYAGFKDLAKVEQNRLIVQQMNLLKNGDYISQKDRHPSFERKGWINKGASVNYGNKDFESFKNTLVKNKAVR